MDQEMTLQEAIETRRSIRKLTKMEGVGPELIEGILGKAMRVPSAMNMQSYRVIALSGTRSDRLWDIVEEALLEKIGRERFDKTDMKGKMAGFRGGNGTLMFFEDQDVLEEKGNIAKSYKETFPDWSMQGSGIFQYAVWLLLTEQGIAASLQHYGNLIEEAARAEWKIPDSWKFISQMPYGKSNETPDVRELIPFDVMTRFDG